MADDPMRAETVRLRDERSVLVRPGTVNDASAILENINEVCAEEVYLLMDQVPNDLERERAWLQEFDGVRNVLFVALDGDTIVGQVDCHGGRFTKDRHTGLVGIAIRSGWREVGLGLVLMDRVLHWMRERGFERAYLSVFSTNVRARRLYQAMGFEVEGVRKRQYKIRGEYADDVVMGLSLRD